MTGRISQTALEVLVGPALDETSEARISQSVLEILYSTSITEDNYGRFSQLCLEILIASIPVLGSKYGPRIQSV